MTKVFDDSKIKQAMEVLKHIKRLGKNLPKDIFFLDTYQNCREAGFCIRGSFFVHDKKAQRAFKGGEIYVAFSENRNSDSIVVYVDDTLTDEKKSLYEGFHGNLMTEAAYKNSESFGYRHYENAAKYIVSVLDEFVEIAKANAEIRRDKWLLDQEKAKTEAA